MYILKIKKKIRRNCCALNWQKAFLWRQKKSIKTFKLCFSRLFQSSLDCVQPATFSVHVRKFENRKQGCVGTFLNSVCLCAYTWVLKWGIYVKIAVNVGYVLGGVLLTNWMDKLSAVSLFLFALKLTFLQGRAARSTVSSHLPLSHRHYKQTMQVY